MLNKEKSKKAISENIKKEMASGKPQKQAIAIAMDVAGKSKKKGKKKVVAKKGVKVMTNANKGKYGYV